MLRRNRDCLPVIFFTGNDIQGQKLTVRRRPVRYCFKICSSGVSGESGMVWFYINERKLYADRDRRASDPDGILRDYAKVLY